MADAPITKESPPSGSKGMNSKLGPLPVWMWALGAGGLVAAIYYMRSKNKAATKTTASGGGCCTDGSVSSDGTCADGNAPSQTNCAQVSQTQLAIVPEPEPTGTSAPPTPVTPTTHTNTKWYTVQKGDTFASIAKKLGTTPQDLFQYQFSDASLASPALKVKLAQDGPNSIIPGNALSYPSNGTYPTYQGFKQSSSANFWPFNKGAPS